jgi:hypothetical protein
VEADKIAASLQPRRASRVYRAVNAPARPEVQILRELIMGLILLIIILILLFGGGGGYYGYRTYGGPGLGGVLGLVVVILLILWLVGGLGTYPAHI